MARKPRVRKLGCLSDIEREMASVYTKVRHGDVAVEDGSKLRSVIN